MFAWERGELLFDRLSKRLRQVVHKGIVVRIEFHSDDGGLQHGPGDQQEFARADQRGAPLPAQRSDHSRRVFAGHLDRCGKTRMSFHRRCNVAVRADTQQIVLPMTGNGAVFDFCGPFPDGDGIDDLTTVVSTVTRVPRAAYTPLGSKVLNQLLFQHSPRLNKQPAVNRFVGHAHTLVHGIPDLQPSGSRSVQVAADLWLSHESRNWKQFLLR